MSTAHPPAARWSAVTRAALGFAAVGAGLLHLALAVGAAPFLAAGLVVVGAAEFLWGVLTTARPEALLPRVAIATALLPPVAWVVLLLAGAATPRPLPMLAATVLDLAVSIGVATALRRTEHPEPRHPVLGVAIAGVVVAALTFPALLATEVAGGSDLTPVHEQPSH